MKKSERLSFKKKLCFILVLAGAGMAVCWGAYFINTQCGILIAAIIATLILFVLVMFYRSFSKLFLRPMLSLMENVKKVGSGDVVERLRLTGQKDFDRLILLINAMVSRLDENSRTIFYMRYKVQKAEIAKQKATINALKKQISAHFTVNTLNVIKRLNEKGESEKAAQMCDGLARLLRYANGADEYINGIDEMRTLQNYAEIMTVRYPDRFRVEFDYDDAMCEVLIPRMLIQPLIENAIAHGALKSRREGIICVRAVVHEDKVRISVQDNGDGMTNEQLLSLREKLVAAKKIDAQGLEHIALLNIQKRIGLTFHGDYGITVESAPNEGFTATVTLARIEE